MKKSEFKKLLRNEDVSAKKYTIYGTIIILLYVIMIGSILYLQNTDIIPDSLAIIISAAMIIFAVIPSVIVDVQNDSQIKQLYENYQKENKMSEYKDKTKYLKIILVVEILLILVASIYIIPNYIINKPNNNEELLNTLSIITNKGNIIETEYEDFGQFSIKMPKNFEIMNDETIAIKYPNGNAPTIVYTNETGSINVALNMNDVIMKNSDIEKYIKTMEETYEQYVDSVNVKFFERDNHKIGEIEFVSPATDTNIYNRLIAFSVDNKLRIVSFNCTEKYIDEWKEVSEFIIESIIFE